MEEQRLKKRMERKRLLEIAIPILLIFSGIILDTADIFVMWSGEQLLQLQDMCRELKELGYTLLLFRFIPYKNIKLKALSFLFALWAVVIIIHNNTMINTQPSLLTSILYSLYLWWLARIALIKKETQTTAGVLREVEIFHKYRIPYNILLPVSTFRGLLQILFIPWANPLYETRILVDQQSTVGIVNNKFVAMAYHLDHVKAIVKKGAQIKLCQNYSKEKIQRLIGKRSLLGIRDCSRLEL